MLALGSFDARTCGGISRRAFVQCGAAGALASIAGRPQATHANQDSDPRPKAESVILLWLWGAPSHIDTFDPKPKAPAEYRGPFTTIATRTPGIRFTELLPRLAARSDRFSLVRSNRTGAPGHPDAGTYGLTGAPESPNPLWPNFGSIVARHRGYGDLPPFVSLGRGIPCDVVRPVTGYGGGKWGKAYDPFLVACSDKGRVEMPSLQLLDGLSIDRLDDRRLLLGRLDEARRRLDAASSGDEWDRSFESAYSLLTSPSARQALDLSLEPAATRDAYGHTSFGQSCLLARRLAQAGVPYIQVNWSRYVEAMTPNCDFGWDTHIYNFELLMDRHGPIFDRAMSALLDDLKASGMADSTLVVAMGEFGRTPKINGQAARDHWPNVYFSLWSGGGIQPARVIGESDPRGEEPVTRAIWPADVGATICELAGVGSQARAELNALPGAQVIHELL